MEKLIQHPIYKDYFADLSTGEVFSYKYNKIKKLKPSNTTQIYLNFNIRFNNKTINKKVHTFIYECGIQSIPIYSNKSSEGLTINHIDSNRLNNSFTNLELISNRKNTQLNSKISKYGKGVHLDKKELERDGPNPYCVKIFINGKYKHIGSFPTPQEAYNKSKEIYLLYFKEVLPEIY